MAVSLSYFFLEAIDNTNGIYRLRKAISKEALNDLSTF